MLTDQQTILMVEDMVNRANLAMVETLNAAAEMIYERSQVRVPKSEDHQSRPNSPGYPAQSLAEGAYVVKATPEEHVAQVVYPAPYAAAQDVGAMTYQNKNGKEILWEATGYTTPDTGKEYLSGSGKEVLASIPEELAINARLAFDGLPGIP